MDKGEPKKHGNGAFVVKEIDTICCDIRSWRVDGEETSATVRVERFLVIPGKDSDTILEVKKGPESTQNQNRAKSQN